MNPWIVQNLWLIPALPLVASLGGIFLGSPQKKTAVGLALTGQVAALLLSLCALAHAMAEPGFRAFHNFTWFSFGESALQIGWLLDPLTASMVVMVSFVGLGIFVFSSGYMDEDANKTRFFAYLSFFSAAMLGLVVSNSLLLLFVCWELVGLSSYLLIGFWIHKPSAAAAAKKAFITTRIGDIGFLLGIVWIFGDTGTTLFYDETGNGCLQAGLMLMGVSTTFIALLLFCGAVGKSGQFPLHVWLPDAMEGPTPVSALIHAATMVTAGIFLVARAFPIFAHGAADLAHPVTPALEVVVWTGVVTAILAAVIAIAQNDIKRILAYSTVSQLGLMMVSLGVGGVAAGIMHLLAHGAFKALLFLGSGSVIHGCHHEQDIRKMGGLRKLMPVTFLTYAIGMMALSGVPLFFAGAWTKEEILHGTAHWHGGHAPHYLMLLGVVLTALYMTRQMIYVFYGEKREATAKAHESPKVMTIPLMVLAACTVLSCLILTPAWPWLHSFLDGVAVHGGHLHLAGIGQAFVLVAIGIGLGIVIYRGHGATDPLEQKQPGLYRMLENKFWIDEFYAKTVLAWTTCAARWSDWMDRVIWDGLARLVAGLGKVFSFFAAAFDEHGVNPITILGGELTKDLGEQVSRLHTGRIQTYLCVIAAGMLALLLLFIWLT